MNNPIDWFGDYPTTSSVVSGVGAAVSGIGLQQQWGDWKALGWGLAVAAFIALPAFGAKRNRLQQGRATARDSIRKMLAACASGYGYPAKHVRANVMLLCAGGTRRRVDSATAFNMDADPDCDLEIDATAGASGEAFVHRRPAAGDLALGLQAGGPTWGLRPSEMAKIRASLRSVLSVPIFDPDDPDGSLLGTLQVDSDLMLVELGFDSEERRQMAERFADVIALLLKTGRS